MVEIAPDDLYFLLQSFSLIALAREKTDWELIKFITLDLLNIGFINETTKDICYKTVKDLLYNIVYKYPELITDILEVLKYNLQRVGFISLLFHDSIDVIVVSYKYRLEHSVLIFANLYQ